MIAMDYLSTDGIRSAEKPRGPRHIAGLDQLAALLAGYAHRNGLAFHDSSPRTQRVSNGRQTLDFRIDRPLTNGHLWTEMEVSAAGKIHESRLAEIALGPVD